MAKYPPIVIRMINAKTNIAIILKAKAASSEFYLVSSLT